MKTTTTITIENLDKVLKQIDKRITEYAPVFGKAIHSALVHGAYTARSRYNGGNNNNGVAVTVEKQQVYYDFAYCRLNADGDQVVFLEFGAGNYTNYGVHGEEDLEFTAQTGVPVTPGSYSSTVGIGMYSGTGIDPRNGHPYPGGYWIHDGKFYRGIYPKRGMYSAAQIAKVDLADTNSKVWQGIMDALR